MTASPAEPWTRTESGTRANVGNYHLSGAYGGWTLHRMHNDAGGVTTPLGGHYRPKSALYAALRAFIAGLEVTHHAAP